MIVGILSDTHGYHLQARAALEVFSAHGAEHIIHCGDVGGPAVFDELVGHPVTFVWGNTDDPSRELLSYIRSLGFTEPSSVPSRLTLDGKSFAVFHGHEREFGVAVRQARDDYLLHGHTHVARDDRAGAMRIINPGALHRANPHSVAVLDTSTDKLTFVTV